ncbi:putative transcriptional regulator, BolA superfamily [Thioflavicoccus mobilis 8321]|uniref:Putative transcriptional regulator, BolA superfamily n=1 Tax=Thioflavicoccus mobilis 8321 TaxID=765912 RepID=L0GWZ8_9GAMM|nr:BolA/IbaG family iron-sulfur metabolism protein [Thioflavicoccus mobilis]AGA91293.1 putative transcriptional regulator, BolA superfamily [Thioflavicoccus mobilis 8321]
MQTQAVARLIRDGLPGAEVQVTGDGSQFEATVVSAAFEGLTPVRRERLVLATVEPSIASGELHAISVRAYTPAQWSQRDG